MTAYKEPHLIEMKRIGESALGYISIGDSKQIPFAIKRAFWTYYTPESIVRGRHAHHLTEQVLFAVSGKIIVTTETADKKVQSFVLTEPNIGVYIPPNVWHTMQYSHTAIQLVFASSDYDAEDYIRDYDQFLKVWGK